MDFSKLGPNERLAAFGAIAAIAGAILAQIGWTAGGLWLSLLLGVAMLAIVFLPQWSPQTTLPGSKGSLMLVVGGIAGIGAVLGLFGLLGLLGLIGFVGGMFVVGLLGYVIGIIGGLMMGWAGWQEFQAEGGKFVLGTPAGSRPTSAPPPAPPPSTEASAAPPPPTTQAPPPPASTPSEPERRDPDQP